MKLVVEHGKTFMKIMCNKCSCKFLYQNNDIIHDYDRVSAYDSNWIGDYVTCPECGGKIKLH